MKKLLTILIAVFLSVQIFAQSSPTLDLRIANATTAFGQNLPIGTKVFNVDTGLYYVATAGVLSTATLTSAAASFDPIITRVWATTPIRSSGGGRPIITIQPASADSAGSLSAADKVKIDSIRANLLLYERLANKSTSVTTDGASDTKYPSAKAVKTYTDLADAGADTLNVHKAGTQTVTGKKTFLNNALFESATFPVIQITRTTTETGGALADLTGLASGINLITKSNGDITDGFGGGFIFSATDPGVTNSSFARIYGRRDGADTEGAIQFVAGTNGAEIFQTIRANGFTGFGTTNPNGKVEVKDGDFIMSDTDVAHGMTTLAPTDAFFKISPFSATIGGVNQLGLSSGDSRAINFHGIIGTNTPTVTTPAINFIVGKKASSGTNYSALAPTETAVRFDTNVDGVGDVVILGSGNSGFRTISPTSYIHLGAGTATAGTAPLGFTSGALLTTPVVGKVEFLTDNWYGTITTGTARKTFAFLESPTFTGTVTIPLLNFSKSGYGAYRAMISDASGNIAYSRALGTSAYKDSTYFQTTLTNPILGSGAGTSGKIPKYTANYTIANSIIDDDGDTVTVAGVFRATGNIIVAGPSTSSAFIKTGGTSAQYLLADGSTTTTAGAVYKGTVNGTNGAASWGGTIADGSGTTGWYAACLTAGTYDYGSGNITLAVGDQLYYNGTIWLKVPGAGAYTLPIATADDLGGVKSNANVSVNGTTGGMTVVTNADLTGEVTSSGNATTIAALSSATLAGKITDETGSGAAVFATSPTLVTPILGTPQSGNFSTGTFTWPTFNQTTTGTSAGLTAAYIDFNSSSGGSSILNKPDMTIYTVKNDSSKLYERIANKVTSVSGASTDIQYPSAKLFYDQLLLKLAIADSSGVGGSGADGKYATGKGLQSHVALTTTAHGGIVALADSVGGGAGKYATGKALANHAALTTTAHGLGASAFHADNYFSLLAGSSSLTTLGTITTGTWNGSVISGQYGGTGVANTGKTITIGGNLSTVGAYTAAFTLTGNTAVTFPTSGTLATTSQLSSAVVYICESFEIPADGSTGSTVTLGHTPLNVSGVTVSQNGAELKYTDQFTVSGTTVTFAKQVYQYDRVTCSYTY